VPLSTFWLQRGRWSGSTQGGGPSSSRGKQRVVCAGHCGAIANRQEAGLLNHLAQRPVDQRICASVRVRAKIRCQRAFHFSRRTGVGRTFWVLLLRRPPPPRRPWGLLVVVVRRRHPPRHFATLRRYLYQVKRRRQTALTTQSRPCATSIVASSSG